MADHPELTGLGDCKGTHAAAFRVRRRARQTSSGMWRTCAGFSPRVRSEVEEHRDASVDQVRGDVRADDAPQVCCATHLVANRGHLVRAKTDSHSPSRMTTVPRGVQVRRQLWTFTARSGGRTDAGSERTCETFRSCRLFVRHAAPVMDSDVNPKSNSAADRPQATVRTVFQKVQRGR